MVYVHHNTGSEEWVVDVDGHGRVEEHSLDKDNFVVLVNTILVDPV